MRRHWIHKQGGRLLPRPGVKFSSTRESNSTYTQKKTAFSLRKSHLHSSEGQVRRPAASLLILALFGAYDTAEWRMFSNQLHSDVFSLSWSWPFFHVKSRLQPCRYWLSDQAWESAQSWKDKLAASCWPIATNQSHHRKRLIVSMPRFPPPLNRAIKVHEEAESCCFH